MWRNRKLGEEKKHNSGRCCFNKCDYIPKLTVLRKWDQSHASTKQWRQGQVMFLGRFALKLRELKNETERHVAKMAVEKNHTWQTDIRLWGRRTEQTQFFRCWHVFRWHNGRDWYRHGLQLTRFQWSSVVWHFIRRQTTAWIFNQWQVKETRWFSRLRKRWNSWNGEYRV